MIKKIEQILKSNWSYDIIQGLSWTAFLSWAKYMLQHFVDIGWSIACAIITTYAVHLFNKWLKSREKK